MPDHDRLLYALALALACVLGLIVVPVRADEEPAFDTQSGTPTASAEALASFELPPGFRATLFAAEPDVRQPIAIAIDTRGRLWVAENYTYSQGEPRFSPDRRDRIVILTDDDGDGRFDRRRVFWDGARNLASVELGFGGVWAACAPHLLFIPDRDGDDVPDGEPEIILDGWDVDAVKHNIVNGLRWGPDGWLWGRHGILATSRVGTPATPVDARPPLNCGVWRYHPTRRTYEVVARGTTNPWGMDWDEYGQPFMINTVIGHLWHVVSGAHYERMYGEDFDPHLYSLMPQTADHSHWGAGENWNDIRHGVTDATDRAGGGHAHSGLMIYLGDNWPRRYRGSAFTINLHGRRLNRDILDRRGAAYVGRHAPDFARSRDPWFRAIDLVYGPDGGVFVADWSDIGECHESDGVHRSSGRIFKIVYDDPARGRRPSRAIDIASASDEELVRLQLHENDWHVRTARRVLQERAAAERDLNDARRSLHAMVDSHRDVTRRLRALWCLDATGGLTEEWLVARLDDANEHMRVQAVRLLFDAGLPSPSAMARLERVASSDASGLVLLQLASSLQALPVDTREHLAARLARRSEFADDPYLPRMLWYGIEPVVAAAPARSVHQFATTPIPLLRRHVARRLASEPERFGAGLDALVQRLRQADDGWRRDVLDGMAAAFRGWRRAPAPPAWPETATALASSDDESIRALARDLSVVFGDGRALDEIRRLVTSADAGLAARRNAIRTLVANRPDDLAPLLQRLMKNRDLALDAVRGLAAVDDPRTPETIVAQFELLRFDARAEAITTLASRPRWARVLLEAVADGRIARNAVVALQIRQMRNLADATVHRLIAEIWPGLENAPADKKKRIEAFRAALTPERVAAADRSNGRRLFRDSCASCHRLFGEGGTFGPDLTGAHRTDMTYLLENIVDPSAQVAEEFRMATVVLADGRVVNGVVVETSDRATTLATPTERLVFERDEVLATTPSTLSMMPEGQLEILAPSEAADLIAYLMATAQVPLPKDATRGTRPSRINAAAGTR